MKLFLGQCYWAHIKHPFYIFLQSSVSFVQARPVHSCAAQETDSHCRQLIIDHHAWVQEVTGNRFQTPCQFGDLEDVFPPGTYDPSENFMGKLHKVSTCQIMQKQWCYNHGQHCDLFGRAAETDLDVSGLPCWDYSLAGKCRQEEGPSNTVFMAHAKMHKERRTPLIIIENVQV